MTWGRDPVTAIHAPGLWVEGKSSSSFDCKPQITLLVGGNKYIYFDKIIHFSLYSTSV